MQTADGPPEQETTPILPRNTKAVRVKKQRVVRGLEAI
jgi:hypothetical protein